ncbi:MAG TPA: TolC family protein [Bacillota bacterium]|nr:TolC family protein [Bacillota bacterium]
MSKVKLDTTLSIPDIKSIDLEKIKEDNLKNNLSYFSAREQYKLAEYELALTEEKYDDYYDELKRGSSNVREEFENMLLDAQKNFEDAEYSWNEKLEALEESLRDQYDSLEDLYESYMEQKEDLDDMKLTVKENKTKHAMGIITKAALDSSIASLDKLEKQLVSTIIKLNKQYMNMIQYSIDE